MDEIWKLVEDYNNIFEASNLGNIRLSNCKTLIKKQVHTKGYYMVSLPKTKSKPLVHRLVAIAFLGSPKEKLEVNHIDGNKKNNNINNLEWISHRDNIMHARSLGLMTNGGEDPRKLTSEDVLNIRRLYRPQKYTQQMLAKQFNVSTTTISLIIRGIAWKNL